MPKTQPVLKTCPVCQSSFAVCPPGKASREYPSNEQGFCSRPCALKARYRRGRVSNIIDVVDAAYIAGFLDGEGSIFLYHRRDKAAMRVTFANTSKPILDWIAEITDCGGYCVRAQNQKHKQSFILQLNADAAYSLLRQVRPYLRIKHKQADLAMSFQERLRDPALNADSTWQQEYLLHMKAMNQRGPSL